MDRGVKFQLNRYQTTYTYSSSSLLWYYDNNNMSVGDVILLIMATILPPLPVAIKSGICSGAFWLNLLLTILAVIPGMIHAWYIILKHPEHVPGHHQAQRDLERNHVTGTYPGHVYQAVPAAPPQHQIAGNMAGVYAAPKQAQNYGATTQGSSHPPAYTLTPDSTPTDTKRT